MRHPAHLPVDQLLGDCRVETTRRSGPGGQHRNKVETAVVVEHLPSGLRGEASERRSQLQNRHAAVQRLRVKLALSVRCEPMEEPSELWRARATGGRMAVNAGHEDYPAVLAEALDIVRGHEFDVAAAATFLGVTTSQLVKLLKTEHEALRQVNVARQARGLSPLG